MKNKQFNYWKVISSFAFVIGLFIGIFIGMYLMSSQVVKAVSNLKIEKVEVGFNESYIMDRMESMINLTQSSSNCHTIIYQYDYKNNTFYKVQESDYLINIEGYNNDKYKIGNIEYKFVKVCN